MKLNELKYNEGSKKDIKRLGRGSSSGTGKQVVEEKTDKSLEAVEE